MVDRISALEGHHSPGHHGLADKTGVILTEVRDLTLHQVAGWPTTLAAAGAHAAAAAGVSEAPGPARATTAGATAVLRIEPLKWWVIGADVGTIDAEQGATLDLSHSRTHIRISGSRATTVLNGFISLDLREDSFPVGAVGSTGFHHIGVTLWRSAEGYELFAPRGYGVAIWQMLVEGAEQYGLNIV